MSIPKVLVSVFVVLFVTIGIIGGIKHKKKSRSESTVETFVVNEPETQFDVAFTQIPIMDAKDDVVPLPLQLVASTTPMLDKSYEINRVPQLFSTGLDRLPIVETVTYTSRVAWLKGRPAWIADYASYYGTSRHFIARSLNNRVDYFTQKVVPGDRFNVFRKDKDIEFYLLVDTSLFTMRFYYIDKDLGERVLLKTYKVGLGRAVEGSSSGCTTPSGVFRLGEKIAIFKPGVEGYFQDQKIEMIQVFGTRWIPFQMEGDKLSSSYPKGYGIHGAPWNFDHQGQLIENRACMGRYESDGCIRLLQEDMEELFSIVITKPTTVEITRNSELVQLPGTEVVPITAEQN